MRTLRVFFTKIGESAYISHLDLQRVFSRAVRQSLMPVWYSQGFNPHIYMSFALPLPLGCESICECVDMKTDADNEDFEKYVRPLSDALPKDINVTSIAIPVHTAKEIVNARYTYTWQISTNVLVAVQEYNKENTAMVLRKTKRSEQMVNLKDVLPMLETKEGVQNEFDAVLPAGDTLSYNPKLLSSFLAEQFGLCESEAIVTRKQMYIATGEAFC